MLTLYDIMSSAQGGEAMRNIARIYGLTPEQTQSAVEALLPAFSVGLKRATQTPDGLAQFFQVMVQKPYAEWFENANRLLGGQQAQQAVNPYAMQAGHEVLQLVFGTENVNRAVAAQAAALSGIGSEVMRAMLPVVASMIVGGLTRMMMQGGPFGQMIGQMMGAPQAQPAAPPPQFPGADMARMWTQMVEAMMGHQPEPQKPPSAYPDLSELSRGFEALGRSGQEIFGQMFEAGVAVQKQQIEAMQGIFDSMMGGSAPAEPKKKR